MTRYPLRLLPGAFVVAAATCLLLIPTFRRWAPALLPAFPFIVYAAGVLLGWRFRSPRAVLAVVMLALADQALAWWGAADALAPPSARAVFVAVALLVPLNFAAFAWMSDRRGRRWMPRFGVGLVALEALVVVSIARFGMPTAIARLGDALADDKWFGGATASGPALLAGAAGLVAVGTRFALAPRPLEGAMIWALVAAVLGLGAGHAGLMATMYLAAAGLALVVGLIETSYALAYQDELTGLPARRALNDALGRLGPRYAVAMVDIDHFKKFNDAHGHDVGDQLLRMVATQLRQIGGGARAFRWGGEEFAVLFPGMVTDEARPYCEGVRKAIAAVQFTLRARDRPRRKPKNPRAPSRSRKRVSVTVSIGVADGAKGDLKPAEVIRAADQALYRAKNGGRNRVAT